MASTNPLVSWFIDQFQQNKEAFPSYGKVDYGDIFKLTHSHLMEKVHNTVVTRGLIADKMGYLTDHGPEHVTMVMRRAADLLKIKTEEGNFKIELYPYEVFLLLLAIDFHDVGNIYGRNGHEARIRDVMSRITTLGTLNELERNTIAQIASTHGGTVDDDRDTIGKVLPEEPLEFGGKTYRPQLLAAILRLADELSDESVRADTFALNQNGIPKESEVYHKYAQRLGSVKITPEEKKVKLRFTLYADDVLNQFGKSIEKSGKIKTVYLLDEIHDRTKKTFIEMIYCLRFMRRDLSVQLNALDVKISVYDKDSSPAPFKEMAYTIKERGYPDISKTTLKQLCDNFEDITGKTLKAQYKAVQN
jgi:hypothetical protein